MSSLSATKHSGDHAKTEGKCFFSLQLLRLAEKVAGRIRVTGLVEAAASEMARPSLVSDEGRGAIGCSMLVDCSCLESMYVHV